MKPERLSRITIYQSSWVNLYLDKVKFPNEVSGIRWLTREEVQGMLKEKAFTDGFTLAALLLWLQNM